MRLALGALLLALTSACSATATTVAPSSSPSPVPPPPPVAALSPAAFQDSDLDAERARLEAVRRDVMAELQKPPAERAKTDDAAPRPSIPEPDLAPAPAPAAPPPAPATADPFVPQHPPAPAAFEGTSGCDSTFAGAYATNWGEAIVTQNGCVIDVAYSGAAQGTMRCTARGESLDCAWHESNGSAGKAAFTRDTDGGWTGSWGGAASATEGGAWTFTRKEG